MSADVVEPGTQVGALEEGLAKAFAERSSRSLS